MSRPRCQGSRKDGAPCRAPVLPDSTLCWVHDPRQAEAARRARAAGASKGAKLKALHGRRRRLDTHAALVKLVAEVAHDILGGKLDPDVARAALYAISIQRQLLEAHGYEQRLADVERRLASLAGRAG